MEGESVSRLDEIEARLDSAPNQVSELVRDCRWLLARCRALEEVAQAALDDREHATHRRESTPSYCETCDALSALSETKKEVT